MSDLQQTPLADQPQFERPGYNFAKRHGILVEEGQQYLHLTCRPGASAEILAEIRRAAGQPIDIRLVEDQQAFEDLLARAYEGDTGGSRQVMEGLDDSLDLDRIAEEIPETEDLLEQEDDAPIIRLINALLTEAIKANASDIHIETYEKRLIVRMRVDGVLREVLQPKRLLAPMLVSRIKVMAKLDIAEKRVPQDGRISLKVASRAVDVRVSTMPSSYGERIVLRLLDQTAGRLDLNHLGMDPATRDRTHDLLHKPHGILLVTGPTGSGKTTTLYAGLTRLNDSVRNILTVEDPVEYNLEGIGQTQVNSKVKMTFAAGLRAILRQDPDVVMVGEIRDLETAEIAVQASLTGHLVLSTLHTNSAAGAVTRLQDMGVEPFLLSSSLLGVLAQRLVRVLCSDCRQPYSASESECELLGVESSHPPLLYTAKGCEKCNGLGYSGRTGIYELIVVDRTLRQMVHDGSGEQVIEDYSRQQAPSMRQDGIRRILAGETTIEEVLRVTREG
ncbi:type II secretion system ATPase GspE [Pelagibaculum spongiae]|uniref:Type II secretion system protein E n=1 Tax=Pelagibaculum spongiae TaxID=2080658 RepID=A0A2V1GU91_9GAMM|nr:type II secretion system ATPase GspE [Pelagibaculum spongiae]PVZ67610.1 type II secretion system protein GspE [Pelagibaculum spongiae]